MLVKLDKLLSRRQIKREDKLLISETQSIIIDFADIKRIIRNATNNSTHWNLANWMK